MSAVNTGGAAFPTGTGVTPYNPGMTLRDYFAAKAMEIYMADEKLIDLYCYLEKDVKQEVAVTAYMMADAMLKARAS
jgi:hypothetical protein